MVVEKNIVRVVATRLLCLVSLAIFLSLIANLFVIFSHTELISVEKQEGAQYSTVYHVPKIVRDQPEKPNGRLLEDFDKKQITEAYQNAWYFLNEALRKKSKVGLEDFFSENQIKEIELLINSDYDYTEDRVDLKHNIDVHLYSIDKQVLAFKDSNVRIKRKVFKKKQLLYEEEIYKSYEVVMTLTDGKWRILHMKEIKNEFVSPTFANDPGPKFVFDSLITFVNTETESNINSPKISCNTKALPGFHKIKKGETVYRLSKKYKVSIKQIMQWNNMKGTSDIKLCSHLRVKEPNKTRKKIVLVTPRVTRGLSTKKKIVGENETIYTIAEDYKIEPAELRKANGIKNNKLSVGQILKIPSAKNINSSKIDGVRGLNYYNQSSPWLNFWPDFDLKTLRKDLTIIKNMRMNTIRVFVPSEGVVPGLQYEVMLDKLELLLDECQVLSIDVIITLFDFPVSFDLSYYPKSERQLEGVLTRFKDHSALLAYDLKNEPDLDFNRVGKKKVLRWLDYLIEKAREYDPNHLITIGWSSPEAAVLLADKLDFVSYHYYRDPKSLTLDMLKLKRAVKKPVLLGEFGIPSNRKWYYPAGYSKEEQRDYLYEMKKEMEINNLPYLLWTLHDFDDIPTEVFGYKKWAHNKQKYFGLLDKNGKKKPSYYIFAPHEKK